MSDAEQAALDLDGIERLARVAQFMIKRSIAVGIGGWTKSSYVIPAIAEYIAAMQPDTALAMVAEIRRLRALVATQRAALADWHSIPIHIRDSVMEGLRQAAEIRNETHA